MQRAHYTFFTFVTRWHLPELLLGLALWLGSPNLVFARAPYDDLKTAEGWAWSQIKLGQTADFNRRCGTPPLDPKKVDDPNRQDACRQLPTRFLVDLLTQAPSREQVPFLGIQIIGARIYRDVDLANAKLVRPIGVSGSRIESSINLRSVRTDSLIAFEGSVISGRIAADGLHSESDFSLAEGATFKGTVTLNGAEIDGTLDMRGSRFEGDLNAEFLQVGRNLFMGSSQQNKATYKNVNLGGAKITGHLTMVGAGFDGRIEADSLQIGALCICGLMTGTWPLSTT